MLVEARTGPSHDLQMQRQDPYPISTSLFLVRWGSEVRLVSSLSSAQLRTSPSLLITPYCQARDYSRIAPAKAEWCAAQITQAQQPLATDGPVRLLLPSIQAQPKAEHLSARQGPLPLNPFAAQPSVVFFAPKASIFVF